MGFIVGTNYLIVFILLVYFYSKILRWIKAVKQQNSKWDLISLNLYFFSLDECKILSTSLIFIAMQYHYKTVVFIDSFP